MIVVDAVSLERGMLGHEYTEPSLEKGPLATVSEVSETSSVFEDTQESNYIHGWRLFALTLGLATATLLVRPFQRPL